MPGEPSLLTATIVQAGAGTGKTESLARRIIEVAQLIYEQKGQVPRFVATTFTERATAELRERVVSILNKKKDAPAWLREFVQNTDDLHISTIHGTLSLMLHRFGVLLGLDPEFTIMSASQERELFSRSLRALIAENQQFGVLLEHYAFGELINMIRELISHQRLHGAKFKVATGWQEILKKERDGLLFALDSLQGFDVTELSPKFGEKVSAMRALYGPIKAAGDDVDLVRRLFNETMANIDKRGITAKNSGDMKPALDFIFELKKERWSVDMADPLINRRHDEVAALLSSLVASTEVVQKAKLEQGYLTFDDLEFLSLELVEKYPEALYSIKQDWDFWFVDEYQDTSPLQKKLIFSFFRTPWNVYFVGDPQQSIYLFRGADAQVFQDTRAVVQKNQGRLERLETNYRSKPRLLDFMNRLFSQMTPPIEPLAPRVSDADKGDAEIRADIHLAYKTETEPREKISEESLVAHQVFEWKNQGHSFHDMAVLVRTNDKARLLARTLSAQGIPVYIHSSGGYYDRREVLDALALLSFLEDPSDDEVFVLVARSPWIAVPDTDLVRWGLERQKAPAKDRASFWDWLKVNRHEVQKDFDKIAVLETAVRKAETRALSTVFEELVERLGFMEFCLAGDASGRREANLRKLFYTLRDAESKPGFLASAFIENAWRELVEPGDEGEAASFIEPQRVNIMTIHKSKGLKFNCVIIPYCYDPYRVRSQFLELSPDGRWAVRVLALESEEHIAPLMHVVLKEERQARELAEAARVFYVAVTRAAEKICLIATPEKAGKEDDAAGVARAESWLKMAPVGLEEKIHDDNYRVTGWTQKPELKRYVNEDDIEVARKLELPESVRRESTRLNVTQLVQGGAKALQSRPIAVFKNQLEAQQMGQAVHFIFEHLKHTLESDLGALCEAAVRRFAPQKKVDVAAIRKTLAMHEPPLRKLVTSGFAEWPFIIRKDDIVLRGQVDLWGDEGDATWIVDYKSARQLTADALAKAHAQLELYALAVNKAGRAWQNIKLAVISPLTAKATILTLSPIEEVMARLRPVSIDAWSEAEI